MRTLSEIIFITEQFYRNIKKEESMFVWSEKITGDIHSVSRFKWSPWFAKYTRISVQRSVALNG